MANKNQILDNDSYWTFQDSDLARVQGLTEYFEYTITTDADLPASTVKAGPNGLEPIDECEVSWFFDDYQVDEDENNN